MGSIDKKTVKHVAFLSRLTLKDNELELYSRQLADILSYINKLNEVDTKDTPPTTRMSSAKENVFRPDVERKSLLNDDALSNAPEKDANFFKIPKVIESFGKSSGFYPESHRRIEGE